jgi:hypothetical protein
MTKEEVKKALYIEKPTAFLVNINNGKFIYTAAIKSPRQTVDFIVSRGEMGTTEFKDEMPAQLLIRWLV